MAVVRGSHGYVEYHPGDMNLVITAPHGGSLRPDSIPSRKDDGSGDVNLKADGHTDEIAAGLTKHIHEITGKKPHFVVSNLHRSRLDPNREEDVAAQGNRHAVKAYREYHDLILQAMVAAAPPQLRISSTGPASSAQADRMGDYYLTAGLDHMNNYPVYKKVDNTQGVYVNDQGNWVVFSRVDSKKRSLRNIESGPASPSPPVRGWEFYDSASSSWVSDPHLKVEHLAPPHVTVGSSGRAAREQPARMGTYRLSSQTHNNHPVYKKEDNSQVMFLNDAGEWVVFERIDPKMRSLKSTAGATAIPPREGWQFWDRSSSSWSEDSRLRVDPPTALLLDIHGQAHGKNSSELGYLLTKAELNAGRLNAEKTSIRGLVYRTGISIAQMLHGPKSLGAFFENAGYKAFPSPRQPSPGKDIYYRGGFTIQEHGSSDGGAVDAIQIEAPGEVRSDGGKKGRDKFTEALAGIAINFYNEYYNNI